MHFGLKNGSYHSLCQLQFSSSLKNLNIVTVHSLFLVQRMLGTAIPTFITVITKDKDRSVAMATLQSLNEVLKAVESLIVDEQGHPDAIANAARSVLMQKVGSWILIVNHCSLFECLHALLLSLSALYCI